MHAVRRIILAAAALLPATSALAAEKPVKALFADDAILHITLKGPIDTIASAHTKNLYDGTVGVVGQGPELPVKLSTRGITRRNPLVCKFPPLRLDFGQKMPDGSIFAGQKKLKLVTHCQPAENFQQFVLLEYSAYKMMNLLTPQSFKVRLVQVDYEKENGKPLISRLGYLIEDESDMAKRNGLVQAKLPSRIQSTQLSGAEATRFAMFNYMIGNLDWSVIAAPAGLPCCHNAKLIAPTKDATSGLIPVSYDFDSAGMVDPPYAAPPAGLSVDNVKTRRYRGYCRYASFAPDVAHAINAKKADILGVLSQTPQLNDASRNRAASYLEGFFAQIATDDGVQKVVSGCLGPAS